MYLAGRTSMIPSTQTSLEKALADGLSKKHKEKKSLQEDFTTSPHLKEYCHYLLRNPSYPRSKRRLLKALASLLTSHQLQQSFPYFLEDP